MRSATWGGNLLVFPAKAGDGTGSTANGFGVPRGGDSVDFFESLDGDGFGWPATFRGGDGWYDKDFSGGDGP